jgi:subtilase family serine protease
MLGNNTLFGSMVIESPVALLPAADLVFILQGGNDPDVGEIYDAHFIVSNWGPDTSPAFNVEWYPFSTNIVGGSWEVPPLAEGEQADLELRFDGYVDVGEFTWTLKIDPAGEVNDPDRSNNVFSNSVTVE